MVKHDKLLTLKIYYNDIISIDSYMGVVVVAPGENLVTGLLIFTKVEISLTLSVSAPVSISLSASLCVSSV